MTKFFIVKNQKLIDRYNEHKAMCTAINDAFNDFAKEHGIESTNYFQDATKLHIQLIPSEWKKFYESGQLTAKGPFKKTSPLGKAWVKLCNERNLKNTYPIVFDLSSLVSNYHGGKMSGGIRKSNLDDSTYVGQFTADCDFTLPDINFTEIKGSEYYLATEQKEI